MSISLIILIVLAVLAITGLVVGVSNDAVNFLNSAIGSKAAPRVVIMIIASIGIIIGCTTSSGMMDIAQNGIFNPALFSFQNVMYLFLAVMFGNIILLDLFNTFGMPTSSTVSLIFGLLGASVAVALCIFSTGEAGNISEYINTGKALSIISGILLSVVIAFFCGSTIMYITRVLFTFDYKQRFKKYGAIWCGIALSAISYFTIVKGFKQTDIHAIRVVIDFIYTHFWYSMGILLVIWTVVVAFLQIFTKVNLLKVIILAGTFALALAFAGNDLVNFIGVFVAGFDASRIANGDMSHMMVEMSSAYKATYGGPAGISNIWLLLVAGIIMVITLFKSKKTGNVSDTEVNLARQDEGDERFDSSPISRFLVRISMSLNKKVSSILPESFLKFLESRFEHEKNSDEVTEKASFDHMRASVNLVVSAILISIATSFKLPLSTTYITFMVAMGTSLSDKAWGRESAVYRITGVLTVIAGWFLTALIAFTIAFLIGLFLMKLETIGIVVMIAIAIFIMIKSDSASKKNSDKKEQNKLKSKIKEDTNEVIQECAEDISSTLEEVKKVYSLTLKGLFDEDRKLLKKMVKESSALYDKAHDRKYAVYTKLHTLNKNYVKTGHYYVQVVDYVNEVTKSLLHITRPSFSHIDNNHHGLTSEQISDLRSIEDKVDNIFVMTSDIMKNNDYDKLEEAMLLRDSLFEDFAVIIKKQLHRLKEGGTSTRSSMLYLDILSETKSMVLHTRNLLKSQKYFVANNSENDINK